MATNDQVNKKIYGIEHKMESLTGVFPSKSSVIRNRRNTMTANTCIKSQLDTKGVEFSSTPKRYSASLGQRRFPGSATSRSSCNNYGWKSTTVSNGYDLYLKYRHVYAGTGNWFKRTPSYKYAYPSRRSAPNNEANTDLERDAGNKRHLHRREIMKKLTKSLQLKKGFNQAYMYDYSPYKSDKVHINHSQLTPDNDNKCGIIKNQLKVSKYDDDLGCSDEEINFGHKEKATQNCHSEDNSSSFPNSALGHVSTETIGMAEELAVNKIDCTEDEKDATFNHNSDIDKCYTNMKAIPHNKFKNQSVAMQASQVDCEKIAQVEQDNDKPNSPIVEKTDDQYTQLSTRKSMKMFSRLSLEARTAMDAAKKEKCSLYNNQKKTPNGLREQEKCLAGTSSDKSIEEIKDNEGEQFKEENESHTKECIQVRKITEGKIKCCCPCGQRQHLRAMSRERTYNVDKDKNKSGPNKSKRLIRSISMDNGLGKKQQSLFRRTETTYELHKEKVDGDGKDYLRTLTKNNKHKNKNARAQKVVPLREVDGEGTFVITPMGYDSRFTDRPVELNVDNETSEEVIKMAIEKCNNWLYKHT